MKHHDILESHPFKNEDFKIKIHEKGYVQLENVSPRICPIDSNNIKRTGDYIAVKAARVSFGSGLKSIEEDDRLIEFLMKNNHTSPFEQADITFVIKAPFFVVKQFLRHRTAQVNEQSFRYTDMSEKLEFYYPDMRSKSLNNKQSSVKNICDENENFQIEMKEVFEEDTNIYTKAIKNGCAQEVARCVLPQSTYTTLIFKQNLHNLLHFFYLRTDETAQLEIREYANAMLKLIMPVFPKTIECFINHRIDCVKFSKKESEILSNLFKDNIDITHLRKKLIELLDSESHSKSFKEGLVFRFDKLCENSNKKN